MNSAAYKNFRFADFEVDATKRLLMRDGSPVALNSKTFDLLYALIERRGEILPKEELLEKIWDGQFVEESNLTVQISTLRKLLGETRGENKFIVTVPGKGYKFVGEPAVDEDEIVVENHRFSHIVIDESKDDGSPTGSARRPLKRFTILAVFIPILILTALGGYFLFRQSRNTAVPFGQNQIRQLTNNGKVQIAELSPDGKLFAYVTDDFGKQTLSLGQVDGGNVIQLRPSADIDYQTLAFSHDSVTLYYSARNLSEPDYAIYKMPAFGGVPEKIVDGIGRFSLGPDGHQIAFIRQNPPETRDDIFVKDLTTKDELLVTSHGPLASVDDGSLSFSTDGSDLAFGVKTDEVSQEVFTVPVSGGTARQVTNQRFGSIDRTAWTPDGYGILLTAVETSPWAGVAQFRIWVASLPSGKVSRITSDLSSYSDGLSLARSMMLTVEHRQVNNVWVAPSENLAAATQITHSAFGKYDGLWGLDWTPDGHIVFDSSDAQSQVISIMNADGSDRKQLTAPGFDDSALSVSRDGRYVVFHSTRNGGFDIWRMDVNGGNLKQLTFGKKNYQPFISADSRYVFYKCNDNGLGDLRRVSIDGGDPVSITQKETSWATASPDGKYFAALYRTDKRRLAIFPLTGGEPFKQFEIPSTGLFFVGLRWTPDSKALVYRDSAYGYWIQSVDGGEPKRLENLPKELLFNFAWSKDGGQFAFVRGTLISDVVLFRSLN